MSTPVSNMVTQIAESDELIEPETIRQWFPGVTEEDFNMLMAIVTIKKSNMSFEDFYSFENTIRALNGIIPNPTLLEGALPKWIWYGCQIIQGIRPKMELSYEVIKYIEFTFTNQGIYFLPPFALHSDVGVDMTQYQETLQKAKHRAESGPTPITPDSFVNNQAIHYLKMQLYSENQRNKN